MCGILGLRVFDGSTPDRQAFEAALERLDHRGPDGHGFRDLGDVLLGHRRLSLIDLASSAQPMSSHDDRLHLSFNGEIFNYQDLRARFPYPYETSGDTETILAAHEAEGSRAVERLEGQFAYGLYASDTRKLWLFRDRLGILPLYYYSSPSVFAFASEIKALLPLMPEKSVDEESLASYLGGRSVPAPYTMFKGIRKLTPGSWVCCDAQGVVTTNQYWELPASTDELRDEKSAVTALGKCLREAVTRSLVADVPVGAYLSGGVDSSLIVALAAQQLSGREIQTFAAGFGDPRHDELPKAKAVSALLGTRHHEVNVRADDFIRLWAPLTWYRDAPISEASDIAVHVLAKEASRHVKAVLSGEGSDELFGGYPKARHARLTRLTGVIPRGLRRRGLHRFEPLLGDNGQRARVALRALSEASEVERYLGWFAAFTTSERRELLGESLPARDRFDMRGMAQPNPLHRMLATDVLGWLSDNLLERADRMSMATSLEVRPPFLDRSVVEMAMQIPARLKVRGGTRKWVVKQVARAYLPEDLVDAPKIGFRVPLDEWLRSGLSQFAWDRLLDPGSFVGETFNSRTVEELVRRHSSGESDEQLRLWTLCSLEIWHEVFFKSVPPTDAVSTCSGNG